MAGIRREPGPTARRVAEGLRRIRRDRNVTTAGLSSRLAAIGHPIADTGLTKTEKGGRQVYVDDLVPLALALGVSPNTLLMPPVDYLGTTDTHYLTPLVSGSAEQLWQWAQGEMPMRLPVPDLPSPLDPNRALEFTIRSRPYLTAVHPPGSEPGTPEPELRRLSVAVQRAVKAGATGTEIRRVVELTLTRPAVMTDAEIDLWLSDDPRPGRGRR